jgi:Ribbon-helix-helix protein, copG family
MAQNRSPKTIRLPDESVKLWEDLAQKLGLGRSEVIELAIQRLAQAEGLLAQISQQPLEPTVLPTIVIPDQVGDANPQSPGSRIVELRGTRIRAK